MIVADVPPTAAMPSAGHACVRLRAYGGPSATVGTIYCLPAAGGSAPFFRSWPMLLPSGVALRAVQLPGRQDLSDVPVFTDMAALASSVADAVAQDAGRMPFVLFGHSMGALTAFETTRELRRRGGPQPLLLALSGYPAPHLPSPLPALHTLPDDELLARVHALGGIPDEVMRNPELLKLSLPALRADFALLASYRYVGEPPLASPLAVFGGLEDALVQRPDLRAWHQHSASDVAFDQFSGGHFFLTRWSSRILSEICTHFGR